MLWLDELRPKQHVLWQHHLLYPNPNVLWHHLLLQGPKLCQRTLFGVEHLTASTRS